MKVIQYYEITEGPLVGTRLEPILAFLGVRYPHRKTQDLYVPPVIDDVHHITHPWKCCQEGCAEPEFIGGMDELCSHLLCHAGRLFFKPRQITSKSPPRVIVELPADPWKNNGDGINADRAFVVSLYRDSIKRSLAKQGVGVKE